MTQAASSYARIEGEQFLDGKVTLLAGDCRERIRTIPDASIDSVVCDPPYALVSIVKRFGKPGAAPAKGDVYARAGAGFMGKQWDTGESAFAVEFWAQVLRVLKPGGHVLAFSGTRTYHRLAVAIEDAGFEIRDQIGWAYGSGFPKSHDVSKGIDKRAGAEREVVAAGAPVKRMIPGADQHKGGWEKNNGREYVPTDTRAATDEARQWQGWGTALKPAWEPIVLARKPLSGTVVETVLEHGTGALNIGACRVPGTAKPFGNGSEGIGGYRLHNRDVSEWQPSQQGRWPANIIHDGSDEVLSAFPDASGAQAPVTGKEPTGHGFSGNVYGAPGQQGRLPSDQRDGGGSAARFFYSAKADAEDRLGSKHPTVKPLDLMQYLVRLVTPPGGTVLDPFAGTGTTGEAAWREGMRAVLIERESEYQADIARRMELAEKPTKRAAVAKSKNKLQGAEGTPLFGEAT